MDDTSANTPAGTQHTTIPTVIQDAPGPQVLAVHVARTTTTTPALLTGATANTDTAPGTPAPTPIYQTTSAKPIARI